MGSVDTMSVRTNSSATVTLSRLTCASREKRSTGSLILDSPCAPALAAYSVHMANKVYQEDLKECLKARGYTAIYRLKYQRATALPGR
eukprot:3070-Heterococcus_DN1.PRE.3